jgi:hypothetical protein
VSSFQITYSESTTHLASFFMVCLFGTGRSRARLQSTCVNA